MGYKSFDFECVSCHHIFEELVQPDEVNPACPSCQGVETEKLLHVVGSAHAAMTDPVKQAEIMSQTQHMRLRLQKRLPWRKSSESQTR